MRTIQTQVTVDDQGQATLRLPTDIVPGVHDIVVMIDETPAPQPITSVNDLPKHNIPWPFDPNDTFRREDMYGDDGR